jgi:hypothetical protein
MFMVNLDRDNVEKVANIGRVKAIIATQTAAVDMVCVTDNLRRFLRIPHLTIEN